MKITVTGHIVKTTMSSENFSALAGDVIHEYSAVSIDPYLGRVIEDMRTYNSLLRSQPVTIREAYEMKQELDDRWQAVIGGEARVTGTMAFLSDVEQHHEPTLSIDFFEDEPVTFGGTMPVPTDVPIGTAIGEDELHPYELHMLVTREALDGEGNLIYMTGSASVEELASIEFPQMMSAERARKWLEYYHAEDIEDIDVDLFAPSKEECEILQRLNGHSVDIGAVHRLDPELMQRSAQALNLYTNTYLTFDQDVPYLMKVDGAVWEQDANGDHEPTYVKGKSMVKLDRMIWTQRSGEDDAVVYPHVVAKLLTESLTDPERWVVIDIAGIKGLSSFRYDYFIGYDT